jgi:predicted esterase
MIMDVRKRTVPCNHVGEPMNVFGERDLIFFKVRFNNFRDVSGSVANEVTDREEWDECECCLCLPENYSEDGEPTQLAIYCHGAGGRVCEETNMIGGVTQILPCVDAGYAALDVNGAKTHGITMGNFEHLMALYKAYRHVVKNYNVTERIVLSGESMGGQVAVNFVNMFPNIVLTVGLFYPRLNMKSFETADGHFCLGTWDKTTVGSSGKSTREWIAEYFHFENGEWNEERVIGFEPYNNRSFTNENGEKVVIPPCPIKIWHGTVDTIVDPVVSSEYVKAVRRGGCYAELLIIEGIGHKTINSMREELRMWFDRFC